ncbi:KRAB-A domain-containing protein 2-like [Zerene cesonia]|uniref:KRAB-A domain-containing protein 2-like n=1 Tax=Zerene cesonia TaxID=33412 RepID=UPI0018E519BA|nr:KRAB-A domain-containing protein 2-like [Zerene cesonia]
MGECSDKKNVNLSTAGSSSLNFKENFDQKLAEYDRQHQGSHRKAWTSGRILEVINDIKRARVPMSSGQRRTAMDYYWMKKYDIMTNANEDCLIFKRLTSTAPAIRILPREQYFDVLSDIHTSCGHGGRDKILFNIKNKYYIPKKAVEIFVSLCPTCENKRDAPIKATVAKPIVSRDFNLRGDVYIMDFQYIADGEFKWLLNYQDNATKFINLRPLKTIEPVEVASELLKIFLTFGAPYVLQSDNGNDFTANLIKELIEMWPECKIIHGNLRCPQTQASNDSKHDVENMLRTWMSKNVSTNWAAGCFFVQYTINTSCHQKIGTSPYKALFGNQPKSGLKGSDIPTSILLNTEAEEQLKRNTEREPSEGTNSDHGNNDNNSKPELKDTEHYKLNVTCAVCHNNITGAYKCESCNNVVRAISVGEEDFSSKIVGIKREIEQDIKIEYDKKYSGRKRPAEEIIDNNIKKCPS